MLKDKTIVVGVTGGIAAFKVVSVVSSLKKMGANVRVIMTRSATEFIQPLTFRVISNNPVHVEQFEEPKVWNVEHISLADSADLFLIAPATANIIGKIANGIADDLLSTTVMAVQAPVLIVPSMNVKMYNNPIVQQNIAKLKEYGYLFMEPNEGLQACGDVGKGRLPEPDEIVARVVYELAPKDFRGKKVVVTAGGTREAIDPVRFLSNPSSGKMGYAIAEAAYLRGAEVVLVSAPTHLKASQGIRVIPVISAQQMYEAVLSEVEDADVVIKAAAVADYTPVKVAEHKIKKGEGNLTIELTRTPDILAELGKRKKVGQILVGFAAETQNLLENAKSKLERKNADLIIANDVSIKGSGFGVDTNKVTILSRNGKEILPMMSKKELAHRILDRVLNFMNDFTAKS
ncbi:phosphopantothenoylcysteine decarboxylase [Anoxybacter fermentans]|uniref:Coenzyme A biosynthesis bifunctional protein CoaBC n=1 Tax=Anoxybacter fermentans TaxID=1323375 RepID=A0A3Q9HPU1_9FIRM|nr:bifunctional phosphopantothenoylcysteine decarboxylase/phosphopantothenate--cysteine ligase CoaBC [Anoxybacter fermentans]AZR72973.1 phosphopantothenoylcysteine decarboxylase [Anoxybacter fermentans]